MRHRFCLLLLLCVLLSGCALSDAGSGNFSQHPGFARCFDAHPRSTSAATEDERMLLQRHWPRLWLPAGHAAN